MKWNQLPYKKRQAIKVALSVRDGLICCICAMRIESLKAATVEHKMKQRNGGSHDLANLGLAHRRCNYSDQHADITEKTTIIDNSSFF